MTLAEKGRHTSMCEYNRSCADEIDFTMADQMHAAALQISKTCFDLKKLCVTFLGVSMVFLIKLTDEKVDHSLFAVGLILIAGFWISDATAYFYQRSLRVKIDAKLREISLRNNGDESGDVKKVGTCGALFNASMTLYYVLAILYLSGWIGYMKGWIG